MFQRPPDLQRGYVGAGATGDHVGVLQLHVQKIPGTMSLVLGDIVVHCALLGFRHLINYGEVTVIIRERSVGTTQ